MSSSKQNSVQSQIAGMSADDWEEFIEEWIASRTGEYHDFERLGGAGDQGRDVVVYVDDPVGSDIYTWDNYQCKHYSDALSPSMIWVEIGKICYFSYLKEYPFPRKYYFVAPKGVGTKLSKYLKTPDTLKAELYNNWEKYCLKGITDTKEVELTDEFKDYIDNLDFSRFDRVQVIKLVDEHSKTPYHAVRFNTPLPERDPVPKISGNIKDNEINYVNKLVLAYNSHASDTISCIEDARENNNYRRHLDRSREEFLHAEALRNFSRDNLPQREFEKIQDQILNGISDIVEDVHPDGFTKVKYAVSESKKLQLGSSKLTGSITVNDRGGICHQLANDDKVTWCQKDD